MRILFDLNVLLDVAIRWEKYPDSLRLYEEVGSTTRLEGVWPACGFTTLYYILKRELGDRKAKEFIALFSKDLDLAPFDEKVAIRALRLNFSDLEDACISASALSAACDYVATRNEADFIASPVPPKHPKELLAML